MGIRQVAASIILATGLAGCATDPGYGLRYSDGGYYSPVDAGHGDYYVGRAYDRPRVVGDPFFDEFGWLYPAGPGYGGWYGSPFYGYGGYCSVRYRYCPRGWAEPFPRYGFRIYSGDPWYGGYRDDRRWRPPHRRDARPPSDRNEARRPPPDARPPRDARWAPDAPRVRREPTVDRDAPARPRRGDRKDGN